ncbi:MAG: tetratricopeptide repeat protein [Saprospiraceae bacterium]|nr:tetratricopeptide repeat protein [Saprospiraceae bacterium]
MNTTTFLRFLVLFGVILGIVSCGSDTQVTDSPTGGVVIDPSIQGINEKIAQNPNDASLYATRAGVYYEQEAYDEAITDLNKAISLDSGQVIFYHVLADVYLDYYKSRLALNVLREATVKFPGDIPTLLKLTEFQLILRQHQGALITTNEIEKLQPLNGEMFFMRGLIRLDMGDTTKAINNFQSAVENDPDIIEGWVNLGRLWSDKNPAFAARFFDNALRRDSTNIEAIHAKAFYLSNYRNDLAGSLALYRRIIGIDSHYEDAYYNSGLLYMDMDSIQKAYNEFNLAIQMNPGFTAAYFYRGVSSEMMGNIEAAKTDYQQTLNLEPNFERAQEALNALN